VIASVEAVEEVVEVAAGVAPVDGFGVGLPVGLEGVDAPGELVEVMEVSGVRALRWRMEKSISIWLSQEACTGRWTRMRLGEAPWRRSIER
jgi:hypothetical protein